jgi:hypothetical protein
MIDNDNNSHEPFNSTELMTLLRGLEQRNIRCTIEHNRTTRDCDGVIVSFQIGIEIWQVGFYDYGYIELGRFVLEGNVEPNVNVGSLLNRLDELVSKHTSKD